MKTRTAWIVYSLLRVAFFAVPFAVLYAIGWHWLAAAVVATLIGAALSIIVLSKPREAAAESVQAWRDRDRMPDDVVEDEAIEAVEAEMAEAETAETIEAETVEDPEPRP